MASRQDMSQVSLVIETTVVRDGRKLGRAKFDADGYTIIPVAALGINSRNNTFYDVASVVRALQPNGSMCAKTLVDGNLKGEYDHPALEGLNQQQALQRLCRVEGKFVSHHIRKLFTGPELETGGKLLMAEIKPMGPFGEALMESLNERFDNTAFSLRSLVSERRGADGITYRTVQNLVTFDAVTAGGYAEASKRYSTALENLSRADFIDAHGGVACENISIRDIDAMFGTCEVTIRRQKVGMYTPGENTFTAEDGARRSLFRQMMRGTRK